MQKKKNWGSAFNERGRFLVSVNRARELYSRGIGLAKVEPIPQGATVGEVLAGLVQDEIRSHFCIFFARKYWTPELGTSSVYAFAPKDGVKGEHKAGRRLVSSIEYNSRQVLDGR